MKKISYSLIQLFLKKMINKRCERQISQLKLAEMVDCHINTINNIETKRKNPSFEMAIRISIVLNFSIDDISSEFYKNNIWNPTD